jgi:hypothetical protein
MAGAAASRAAEQVEQLDTMTPCVETPEDMRRRFCMDRDAGPWTPPTFTEGGCPESRGTSGRSMWILCRGHLGTRRTDKTHRPRKANPAVTTTAAASYAGPNPALTTQPRNIHSPTAPERLDPG